MVSISAYLPPIGLEIRCISYAFNVPLRVVALGIITLDFRGGWRVRVEENIASDLGGVKLKVIGNEWTADSPVLGQVTISQADIDTTPLSPLEIIGSSPVYCNTMFLDFTVTFEKPPGGGPPLMLANTKTATLLNDHLRNFPPEGDVYQLQEPVDLAPAGNSDQVLAQLQQFPLTVTYSP